MLHYKYRGLPARGWTPDFHLPSRCTPLASATSQLGSIPFRLYHLVFGSAPHGSPAPSPAASCPPRQEALESFSCCGGGRWDVSSPPADRRLCGRRSCVQPPVSREFSSQLFESYLLSSVFFKALASNQPPPRQLSKCDYECKSAAVPAHVLGSPNYFIHGVLDPRKPAVRQNSIHRCRWTLTESHGEAVGVHLWCVFIVLPPQGFR